MNDGALAAAVSSDDGRVLTGQQPKRRIRQHRLPLVVEAYVSQLEGAGRRDSNAASVVVRVIVAQECVQTL